MHMRDMIRPCVLCLALFFGLAAGCADKLTYDRYQTVQVHRSTEGEVRDLLGEPDDVVMTSWWYNRPDQPLHVIVTFDDQGVVSRKEWMGMGRWHDSDEPASEEGWTETTRSIKDRKYKP